MISRRKRFLLSLALGAGLFGALGAVPPAPAEADDLLAGAWQITADRLTHFRNPERVVAEGAVTLLPAEADPTSPLTIRADRVEYLVGEGLVHAVGNLEMRSDSDTVTASEARLDLGRQTGVFTNAAVFQAEKNFHLYGSTVEKTGPLSYRLLDGWLTTCPVEPGEDPAWSLHTGETSLTREGYAVLRDSSFRVSGLPIFYTPFLVLPAKTTRQSGLLFPEFSQSERSGIGLTTPFFVNLSPSTDITLAPGFLSERGPSLGLELRYVMAEHSLGTFQASFLRDSHSDSATDDYRDDGVLRSEQDRYWLRGKIDHDFGFDLVARLDLDLVSDHDFLREFSSGITGYNKSRSDFENTFSRGFQEAHLTERENSLQVSKSWSRMNLSAEFLAVDEALEPAGVPTPLMALPRTLFGGRLPVADSGLDLLWDSEYVYYWREKGLGGHRLDLHPRLAAPLALFPQLEASATLGGRYTTYQIESRGDEPFALWTQNDFQDRALWEAGLDLALPLARSFSPSDGPYRTLTHLLRPEVGFVHISESGEEELPQFDNTDLVDERNWLRYGIHNYLRGQATQQESPWASGAIGSFKLDQVFDFDRGDKPFSDLHLELALTPGQHLRLASEAALSIHGEGVPFYAFSGAVSDDQQNEASLGYRYKRHAGLEEPFFYLDDNTPESHELQAAARARLTDTMSAAARLTHSFSLDELQDSTLELTYQPACWAVTLSASMTPDDTRLGLMFSLSGLASALGFGGGL